MMEHIKHELKVCQNTLSYYERFNIGPSLVKQINKKQENLDILNDVYYIIGSYSCVILYLIFGVVYYIKVLNRNDISVKMFAIFTLLVVAAMDCYILPFIVKKYIKPALCITIEQPKDTNCCACRDAEATIAFISCGHLCVCKQCETKIMANFGGKKSCPMCRTESSVARIWR